MVNKDKNSTGLRNTKGRRSTGSSTSGGKIVTDTNHRGDKSRPNQVENVIGGPRALSTTSKKGRRPDRSSIKETVSTPPSRRENIYTRGVCISLYSSMI
jgi:hypothetical protein